MFDIQYYTCILLLCFEYFEFVTCNLISKLVTRLCNHVNPLFINDYYFPSRLKLQSYNK